ncbi:MAG TPA: metallopeptidase family protein [Candidatus Parcubacteria bacterium]|nr:metallopeptidase family protein [Candidatus Parcubacteria bacterium]
MEEEKFRKIVEEELKFIPDKFLKRLNNVDICVEGEPSHFQLKKLGTRKDGLLLGLYEGVPQTQRGNYAQALPDKITIFKKAIEQISKNNEEIRENIRIVIWHEVAHHFGLNEDEVRRLEKERRRRNVFKK